MRKLITISTAAVMFVALALVPGTALARHHRARAADANHDRIPDRWEKRNHLSLNVKQTRRDQDHDGLNNLGEFRAGTNPHDADTDNDGIHDGAEHAGTIASFDSATGTLTITLAGGGSLTGQVTADTEIECAPTTTTPTASSASDGGSGDGAGDGSGDNQGSGDGSGDNHQGAGDDQGDNGDEGDGNCTTADLTVGATVHEAKLEITGGGAVFTKLELG